jgi:hypothetical protein
MARRTCSDLHDELTGVMNRFCDRLSLAEMVGIMECVRYEWMSRAYQDTQTKDDDDESESWKDR